MFEKKPVTNNHNAPWAEFAIFGRGDIMMVHYLKRNALMLVHVDIPRKIGKYEKFPQKTTIEDLKPKIVLEFEKRKSVFWLIWELMKLWIRFDNGNKKQPELKDLICPMCHKRLMPVRDEIKENEYVYGYMCDCTEEIRKEYYENQEVK